MCSRHLSQTTFNEIRTRKQRWKKVDETQKGGREKGEGSR